MKAIRTIHENPIYREWVVFIDEEMTMIGTCSIPALFGDGATLDMMFKNVIFHPEDIPRDRYEMVDVELVVVQDKVPYANHELDIAFIKKHEQYFPD